MERKEFLRNSLLIAIGTVFFPKLAFSKSTNLEIVQLGEPISQLRHGKYDKNNQEITRTIYYQDGLNGAHSQNRISSIQIGKDYNQLLILKNGEIANQLSSEIVVWNKPDGLFKNPFKKSLIFSESKDFEFLNSTIKAEEGIYCSENEFKLNALDSIICLKIE